MSAVDLLEPILKGGVQRNNFFNGRLLSAEDLRAEQTATGTELALLARTAGDGVGWGLDVSIASVDSGRPRVTVTSGLAVNRLGTLLRLADDAEVALVPATTAAEAAAGIFAECEPPRPTGSLSGAGAYVLAIAPSSGYSGTAMVSDPNTTAAGRGACGARFSVEGVRFRLVPIPVGAISGISEALRARIVALLPPSSTAARERLRNLLAHLCFGTQTLGFADPPTTTAVRPVLAGWGAIDAMRSRGDLTDCDVPLAVVVLTSSGISFVDMWPARRKLVDAAAIDAWRGVASPRRLAEAEAAFLQFEQQIAIVKGEASPGTIAAGTYFDVLPAGGWLPTGAGGFDWSTFLGPHAPPAVTPVDAALLRGILERSWFDEPFALATTPPVPVRVYEVPEQVAGESFVVFARSANGNIRVTLSPAPTANETVEVTATAETGQMTRATTRHNGTFPITELAPGLHHVAVAAPDYVVVAPRDATVVGGRTVDLAVTLTPLPNGSIVVEAIDKATGGSLGERVDRMTASDGITTYDGKYQPSSGKWLFDSLPPTKYSLSGSASGYQTANRTGVGPTVRGQTIETQLIFEPISRTNDRPQQCFPVKEAKTPKVQNVRFCFVVTATEFDERYYYREKELARARGISTDELRITKRGKKSATSRPGRYVAETGEILYSTEPWKGMRELDPKPPRIDDWLHLWAEWFATELDDERIAKLTPILYFDANYRLARNASDVRATPPGYAVFQGFAVPIAIKPDERVTKSAVPIREEDLPGIPELVIRELYDAEIRYIDDLAWAWEEIVIDATGEPREIARYLIADAVNAIPAINEERRYLAGNDKATDKAMKDASIQDDVALANADVDKLGEKVGSRGFALRLIDQARHIVPDEAWTLDSLGLTEVQVEGLNNHGIYSKGDLASSATRADGRTAIAEALGVDDEAPATRDAAVSAIVNQATMVMAASSVALAPQASLALWEGVDAITAANLAAADIVSVDDLAAAKPEAVAEAAHVTADTAGKLVDSAKESSRASLAIGMVSSVSRAEEKALKDTFGADATLGTIAGKTADELAVAFGGNVGRANAVLAGIKAGLTGTRGGIG